jgi:hypothetical protein
MGWTIILENENGQVIQALADEFNYDELDNLNFENYFLLKYIDFYGDTTFNALQLNDLISDFEKLRVVTTQGNIIEQILGLIKKSQEEVHTYIKFYGD